jgi:hypothetical protein
MAALLITGFRMPAIIEAAIAKISFDRVITGFSLKFPKVQFVLEI